MVQINEETLKNTHVAEGGSRELWQFAPLKAPKWQEWQEEDGAEADLSTPRLDAKSGTLILLCASNEDKASVQRLCIKPRRQTRPETPRTLYIQAPELVQGQEVIPTAVKAEHEGGEWWVLSINYTQHQQLLPDRDVQPLNTSLPEADDFRIDGIKISDFGARVLEGSTYPFAFLPMREWSITKHPLLSGQQPDLYAETRYKTHEVTMHLFWKADTLQRLWSNRKAFLARLTLEGERTIAVRDLGTAYKAVYKSENITAFYPSDNWIESDITFTIIQQAN